MSEDAPHGLTGRDSIQAPAMTTITSEASISDLGINYREEVGEAMLEEARQAEFSPEVEEIIRDDGVLGDRRFFTWQWIYYIFGEPLTIGPVSEEHQQIAQEAKFLAGAYITLVDDLAEKHGDKKTFWELAKAAYPGMTPDWDREDIRRDYARSTERVWNALTDRLQAAPRFEEFVEPFMYDLRVAVESMDFARMSGEYPAFANRAETWQFETAAIGVYVFWDADLMFAPSFDRDDYHEFREAMYEVQHMWRLGNWVITWEREVHEKDFSAGIFVEAIRQGVISENDLERLENGELDPEVVTDRIRSSGIVGQFVWDWKRRRDELRERAFEMESLDASDLVDKMEWLMRSHLATEGHR